jgi:hypothetical protein
MRIYRIDLGCRDEYCAHADFGKQRFYDLWPLSLRATLLAYCVFLSP